ncbi:hypothetical protein M3212_07770 [Alkalihalobacillus oceani]|uniref:hypothetical protein n=1 Tax=Halalkalibacter oceani TaxID=1653776 RepID=UPI0020420A4B|nr:hypothetical protein [Halalkalibacter oceani]MCM3760684.1 hypothetical protein [Halalkalibacter oceani]
MRVWRVGTISMGASLLLLGVILLIAQFSEVSVAQIMLAWWPVILIILGLEMLVYLFLSKQEKPLLHYDFLSIFFVAIIGTAGIAFALASSTGLLDFVENELAREERTLDLPPVSHALSSGINRVVVQGGPYPLTVEATADAELSLFGTYRASLGKEDTLLSRPEEYASIYQRGDTLYLIVKQLPQEITAFGRSTPQLEATIFVPGDVEVEVVGKGYPVNLKPRNAESSWTVENASAVSLYLQRENNVEVSAIRVEETVGEDESINRLLTEEGSFMLGDGTHQITIIEAFQLTLTMG